jgi:hypothetical protein
MKIFIDVNQEGAKATTKQSKAARYGGCSAAASTGREERIESHETIDRGIEKKKGGGGWNIFFQIVSKWVEQ